MIAIAAVSRLDKERLAIAERVRELRNSRGLTQADIDAMIQRDLVPHDELIAQFRSAVDVFSHDARAEDLPKYVEHLHRIERDMLGVDETAIELPSWI